MERGRAIITALVLGIAFGLFWWFCIELPRKEREYKASITEIEAEILNIQDDEIRLRKVDTQEEVTIEFSMSFLTAREEEGLPEISEKYDWVVLSDREVGYGSIYRIKYGGIGEIKDPLEIELIQSKEEWLQQRRELAKKYTNSDEMPDVSDWILESSSKVKDIEVEAKIFYLLEWNLDWEDNIVCFAYYDTSGEGPVLKAMRAFYYMSDEAVVAKVWIIENGKEKFYRLEEDDERRIHISKENSKVKFELR